MIKSCFVLIFILLPWFSLTWALVPPVPSIQASFYFFDAATTEKAWKYPTLIEIKEVFQLLIREKFIIRT